MKKEDKELLLKDLCARLPYGLKVDKCNHIHELQSTLKCGIVLISDIITNKRITTNIENIRPYLFPLSSLTAKQKQELWAMGWVYLFGVLSNEIVEFRTDIDCRDLIDWLTENHIDYRGLIEKGLAIDASNLNIYEM